MALELRHYPIIVGENGHLLATDGELSWVIVVTRAALETVNFQYDATSEEIAKHAGILLAIAEERLAHDDFTRRRIWVQEEDVDAWLSSEPLLRASLHAARTLASGARHLLPQVTARLF